MLEKISLIASIISALTSVTTSLRAVGRSREHSQYEPHKLRKILLLYRSIALIWFGLSLIFAVPVIINGLFEKKYIFMFPWVMLGFLLWLIWRRVLRPGN